jgi:hypothetical protein
MSTPLVVAIGFALLGWIGFLVALWRISEAAQRLYFTAIKKLQRDGKLLEGDL